MLGMTGAEILTALLIATAATVLQGWLLRRSVKVRTYHTNVVHMSAFMRWLAQGMVGIVGVQTARWSGGFHGGAG